MLLRRNRPRRFPVSRLWPKRFSAPPTALDLAGIATVRIERDAFTPYLKVGRLRVVPVDSTQPPMVLEGVYSPDQIAALIMHEVHQIRTGTGHDSSINKV